MEFRLEAVDPKDKTKSYDIGGRRPLLNFRSRDSSSKELPDLKKTTIFNVDDSHPIDTPNEAIQENEASEPAMKDSFLKPPPTFKEKMVNPIDHLSLNRSG
mmetsp:Transcript_2383/g.3644  ORF Transcript_2383/g.3644 Transcript_2383/m.3644 type:complete len:101 (-) Transcript_2383:414-716(-)